MSNNEHKKAFTNSQVHPDDITIAILRHSKESMEMFFVNRLYLSNRATSV